MKCICALILLLFSSFVTAELIVVRADRPNFDAFGDRIPLNQTKVISYEVELTTGGRTSVFFYDEPDVTRFAFRITDGSETLIRIRAISRMGEVGEWSETAVFNKSTFIPEKMVKPDIEPLEETFTKFMDNMPIQTVF